MSVQGINGMNNMISALNSVANQVGGKSEKIDNQSIVKFSDFLSESIGKVDLTQKQATDLAQRLISGDNSINLHDVMIASQTSSLSFQQAVQVRNKIVNAYQEIMSMQV